MPVPKVAIVGRPNVGKSSLLNWLAGKLISVVDPTAGVTRDRVTYLMHEQDRYFELVDTGGIGIVDVDDLTADIERQIQIAIDEADLILFVVDGTSRRCCRSIAAWPSGCGRSTSRSCSSSTSAIRRRPTTRSTSSIGLVDVAVDSDQREGQPESRATCWRRSSTACRRRTTIEDGRRRLAASRSRN